ncbi:MAG: SUMF1/EgtB/PvdO family nonheme iron enzyme [Candidatus Wallbacteria bacterium]|nr:SUMF1/EgtB/PvdO family nonheme iron enzyme [Candidatus Wallbacteria bacterium]
MSKHIALLNFLLLFIFLSANLHPLSALTSQIPLRQGWNLISLGLTPPSGSIEVLFSNLPDLKYVMGFFRSPADEGTEGFRTYMNSDDLKEFSTLKTMDGLHGYWIYMNGAATLEVNGTEIADTREWSLSAGWNLAGYWLPSGNNLPTLETQTGTVIDSVFNLTSIDGVAKYIMGFYRDTNGGMEGFRSFMNNSAISFSNLKSLDPVHGYWYYMDGPGVLEYLAGLPARSLTGITVSPSSITLNPGTNYDLSKITVKAVYSNDSQETAANVTWSRKSGGGTLSGSTYTAPGSEGTAELIASFTSRNITATRELTVTVTAAPLPVHVLTVTLAPVDAVSAGAQWSIDHGTTWRFSGDTVGIEENAAYTIECKAVSGWTSPDTVEAVMGSSDLMQTLFYVQTQGATWQQAAASAMFSARYRHSGVVFNNRMWVICGSTGSVTNDVWYSTDGVIWTCATANAAFEARDRNTILVFDDKMWLISGYGGSYRKDVWYSTDGVIWTCATANAAFPGRGYHSSLVFDNRMWVIGGYTGSTFKNDVWYSRDGITWVQATASAAFSGRDCQTTFVYDNKMWLIGGFNGSYLNDVWYSTDGINWIQAISSAAFSTRYSHTSVVYDGKMWVIDGYNGSCRGDIWCSTDGITWTRTADSQAFSARYYHTSLVYNDKIWVIGGEDAGGYKNDVWYTSIASPVRSPLYLTTKPLTLEVAAGTTFEISTVKMAVFYSNNTTEEVSSVNYSATRGTSNGTVYTAPASAGTDTIEVTYIESGKSITTHLVVIITQPSHTITLAPGVVMDFVWIPAGNFTMGSPTSEVGRNADEGPQHIVTITQGFYLGKYEVTQAQWQAVMGNNPSYFQGASYPNSGNLPVEQVSWDDCQSFISSLEVNGFGNFRLPTEAEWEYSCRAGTSTAYYWGDNVDENCMWYYSNSGQESHDVGTKQSNGWGLYDMLGNVWEWCNDWYGAYSSIATADPAGSSTGSNRVCRSGSWADAASNCRTAARYCSTPEARHYYFGLRVVADQIGQ